MQSHHRIRSSARFARFVRSNAAEYTADWSPERWQAEYVATATLRGEQRAAKRAGCSASSELARHLLGELQVSA